MSDTAPNTSNSAPPPGDMCAGYEHCCKVAVNFVMQYYTMMHSDPSQLHRFYVSESAYVHGGNESGKCLPALGQKQIQDKVDSLQFTNVHTAIKQIDSLPAPGNGILIQVTGELSTRGSPMRAFVQSFVLSQDGPKKYSIVSDIFRYQEDGDGNDEEIEPSPADAQAVEGGLTGENGDVTSQEILPSDPVSDPDASADIPAVPAGSQPIVSQPLSAVPLRDTSPTDWNADTEEISDVPLHNGPEFAGESYPADTADTEDTQPPASAEDSWPDYPESADQATHVERAEQTEREREREAGETGGRGTSYAFVSSIHTPQTGAKIAEQKFQTRPVYTAKKKPVSSGVLSRASRETRPPAPPQGGYRPKGTFDSANRLPRDSFFQIFVGGLPKDCTSDELRECFRDEASVTDVRINPNGFGFVGFANEEQVARVIDLGDRHFLIRSNYIRVERKGSTGGKPSGVKKRDGPRGGSQTRHS